MSMQGYQLTCQVSKFPSVVYMLENKLNKTPVKIYEASYKELDQEKLRVRMSGMPEPSFAELIDKYIRRAKAMGEPGYVYNEGNRVWHDKLETVLNSGDEETISAVTQNIKVFFDRLRPVRAARRAGGK